MLLLLFGLEPLELFGVAPFIHFKILTIAMVGNPISLRLDMFYYFIDSKSVIYLEAKIW